MTQKLTKAKAREAIDALLAEKDSDFRAVVFELCHRLDWPDDEPSFLLAIATNQLEALVMQYPERISEAMQLAAKELEQDWQQMQAKLALSAMKSTQTATRMTNTLTDAQLIVEQALSRTQTLLEQERSAMVKAMETEHNEVCRLLSAERKTMAKLAQELAEQQKQVLEAHTKDLIAQAVMAHQERAERQVQQIVKGVRMKHFWETFSVALIAALSIAVVGWTAGWFLGQQRESTWDAWQRQVAQQGTDIS